MSALNPNEIFASRYILAEKVGNGGFSEVWKAYDAMTEEAQVAIKIYAPGKGLDNNGIKQFRQEYAITHHISHPHLMKVYYFDIVDGSPYLIMPYYERGSLGSYLLRHGAFDEKQTATLMHQMGSALCELHKQSVPILHQDIKPDNILVYRDDHFVLTDFGISTQTRHTLRKATSNLKPLTIAYAPPERFAADPVESEAGDVFSLGVTLYEMCTGEIPWGGDGGVSLLKGAQVPHLPPSLPIELNRMLRACLMLDWQKRPSAEQVAAWGKFYLDNGYWQFAPFKPPALWQSPIAVAGAGVLVVAGGILWYALTGTDADAASAAMAPPPRAIVTPNVPKENVPEEKDNPEVKKDQEGTGNKREKGKQEVSEAPAPEPGDPASARKPAEKRNDPPPPSPVRKPEAGTNSERDTKPQSDAKSEKDKKPEVNTKPQPGKQSDPEPPKPAPVRPPVLPDAPLEQPAALAAADVEAYLNRLSDKTIPRQDRKTMRNQVLSWFAGPDVPLYDDASGIDTRYGAKELLDKLLYSPNPYRVTIRDVHRDPQGKITGLSLKTQIYAK